MTPLVVPMTIKRLPLVLLCCALIVAEGHTVKDYSRYQVLKIQSDVGDHRALKDYLKKNGVDVWKRRLLEDGRHEFYAMASPQKSEQLIHHFRSENLRHSIEINDVQKLISSQLYRRDKRDASKNHFDYNHYNKLENIVSELENLNEKHDHVKLKSIGTTANNRSIYAVKISSNQSASSGKPAIMLEFGAHAREWISTASALFFINQLASRYGKNAGITSIVDKFDWYIIPLLNPDGYAYTWTYDRLWRKNLALYDARGSCIGVDINRNFNIQFDDCKYESMCSEIYCGPSAFSEPESRAIRDLAISIKDRLKAYFSIHSFSQLISYPHGYTSKPDEVHAKLEKWTKILAKEMGKPYGTKYMTCNIAQGIYKVSGDSVDWVHDVVGVEASLAIELRDNGEFGFLLPEDQIEPTATELFVGIINFVLQL